MKIGRFSISTLLLATAIMGMAVHIFIQGRTLIQLRTENAQFREELGEFDENAGSNILVRPLLNRGPNTWRYRIYKEGEGFRYGFGIVDVDSNGSLILPPRRNRLFQWMPSGVDGEAELTFSIRPDNKTNWYMVVSESTGYELESSNSRLSKYTFDAEPAVWNFKPPVTIINDLTTMETDGRSNGKVNSFELSETVVLFRSESPVQTGEIRKAFAVVFQRAMKSEAE